MVLLTALLFPIALVASTSITSRVRGYAASMLFLEAGILGVFVASTCWSSSPSGR